MTKEELAQQAFQECCDLNTAVRHGTKGGLPFWNVESTMFMYVPAFHFTAFRNCHRYRFDALDEQGTVHFFESDDCCARLTPIWAELPVGKVQLTVTALKEDGTAWGVIGARTFFRSSPFTAENPPAVCSYKECAIRAYRYAMAQPFIQYWLNEGKPDPHYDLNSYPAKMIGSLVKAMISYAKICPEDAENAMKVAVNAADYLMAITPRGDQPLADLPPTYYLDFCPDPAAYGMTSPNWKLATTRVGTSMMMYPAYAGVMYVALAEATGEKKYLEEAVKIGRYYQKTVEPNGSWFLVRSEKTGEPLGPNYIAPLDHVVPFLTSLYEATKEPCWKELAENAVNYVMQNQLPTYNWEGQFEDTAATVNYCNLTHYAPGSLAKYLVKYHQDDPQSVELAKELMRFVEDQFVLWKQPYPWPHHSPDEDEPPYDTAKWHTPAALEQYFWYVPIDASTSAVLLGFLAMYKAGCGSLYLAKAQALADQLTRMQQEDGKIPTHWMHTPGAERNFWFNCMFASCEALVTMAEYENVEP